MISPEPRVEYQKPKLDVHSTWISLTAAPFSTGPIGPGGLFLPDFLELKEQE